jgi:UDP-N-acetylglucosamine pyrophosphorylase
MGCASSKADNVADAKDVKLVKAGESTTNGKVESTPSAADAAEDTFAKLWPAYEEKMKAEGLSDAAIAAFRYNFSVLTSGKDLMIPESTIKPVDSLPDYADLTAEDPALLKQTVMVKLNGGLGTGMGLEKAKSLLDLKDGMTFLDFIASQVTDMRQAFGVPLAFMLMNSFATSADTKEYLAKYPDLQSEGLPLEFVQNKAPKLTESDLTPASWPSKPDCEWCPPGHGDLYPAMLGTDSLDSLLAKGYKYMFVSNSDNLGATMDLKLLTWFAQSGKPFAMECAQRTDADKKGGHLARADAASGQMLLRESAQCPDADEKEFQNVEKYKFFNTNNLWVDLAALKKTMDANEGVLPLPVIKNGKTVDPRDKKSTKVLQLETAMGAAIASFEGAGAILIPRTRFAPVKTTNDMLALMSDAYEVTKDFRMVLKAERNGTPPNIKLDGAYKFVDALQELVANGPPSLIGCSKLAIEGKCVFAAGVVIKGEVKIVSGDESKTLAAGTYENQTVTL